MEQEELERTSRMVLENGCPLTVSELAKVIMNYDMDICAFCEKGDRAEYHEEFCPFAIAYQVLTPKADIAVEMARSRGIDDAVRIIAKSGKNHDMGLIWYAECDRGELQISATFGAGTNSASVQVTKTTDGGGAGALSGIMLYEASDYGGHVTSFRTGPWVNRLLARADELRQANKIKAAEMVAKDAASQIDKFKEVDF